MFILKKIELKVAIAFSVMALIVSPVVGGVAGITPGVIALRVLVLAPIFFGIGYGIVYIIKRFVPEVYQIINPAYADNETDIEDIDAVSDQDQGFDSFDEQSSDENTSSEQKTDNENQFDKGLEPSTSENLGIGERKMGKHLLEEKGMKYEPKIMAEAIRTMMSRDED